MASWAIMALNAALFGGCCFLVADVVVQIAGDVIEPGDLDAVAPTRQESPADQRRAAAPSVILDRNLFGAQLEGDVQIAEPTAEPLTKTKLPLRLLGTAAATEESRSRAAIEDEKTRKHMVVAVGDAIEGHARVRVDAIERTRVILDNAGRPEELLLFEDRPPPPPQVARATPRKSRRPIPGAKMRANQRLRELAGEQGNGIADLLSQARISPAYDAENGDILGMKVEAIKQGSLFESAGLQDGDVITEVNGIIIDRQDATPAVLEELLQADTIEIAADRGGSPIKLSADAAELMEQR
jgi:general secretion pathway protein C